MAASTSVNFTIIVAVNSGAVGGTTITNTPVTVSETGTNPGTPKQHLNRYHGARRRSFDDRKSPRHRLSRPARRSPTPKLSPTTARTQPLARSCINRRRPTRRSLRSRRPQDGRVARLRHLAAPVRSCAPLLARWRPTPPADRSLTSLHCSWFHGRRHHHRQFRRRHIDNHRPRFIEQHHVHVRAGGNHREFGPGDFHDRRARRPYLCLPRSHTRFKSRTLDWRPPRV